MSILENLKTYFKAKAENLDAGNAPEGICPNCWGKQEWDGEFYKKIKAKNITPESKTYTSFIREVVQNLDEITLKPDAYICETCTVKTKS